MDILEMFLVLSFQNVASLFILIVRIILFEFGIDKVNAYRRLVHLMRDNGIYKNILFYLI
jgi:hypothetical protein